MGGNAYLWLIKLNRLVNNIRRKLGRPPLSLAHKVKRSVKQAVKFIGDFENEAIQRALKKHYDYVVCGHIHIPQIKKVTHGQSSVIYMNAGDWVENMTALEMTGQNWSIYRYDPLQFDQKELSSVPGEKEKQTEIPGTKELDLGGILNLV